jgi:hypothetical protein
MLLPKETYLCSEDLKHTIALAQTFQQVSVPSISEFYTEAPSCTLAVHVLSLCALVRTSLYAITSNRFDCIYEVSLLFSCSNLKSHWSGPLV